MTCPCEPSPDEKRTWCPKHRIYKTRHWITLCQTRPEYRAAWDAGRGPGQVSRQAPVEQRTFLPWLQCAARGKVIATVPGGVAGCGCASQAVEVYQCEQFDEPVLKFADSRRIHQIAKRVPGYQGRQCRTCESPQPPDDTPRPQTGPAGGTQETSKEPSMRITVTRGDVPVLSREIGPAAIAVGNKGSYRNVNAEKQLPATGLISPADHAIVQLEITNRCFLNCSNCTRLVGHQQQPYEMDRETFRRAVESVADHPGMIGIMGGEPTMHADFDWLVRLYADVIQRYQTYQHLRDPVIDLAGYRLQHCSSLHHRRGLWSAIGPRFLRHIELISDVFGYWCLNDHSHQGKHQALLMARRDLGVPDDRWQQLRDQCWIQRTWSSSINPAGAYFCEVAAAIDWTLFGGRHAWPIEPGWWRRTPAEFGAQLGLCEYCAAPLDVPARLPAEARDDLSPTVYQLLADAGSPRVKRGAIVVHGTGDGDGKHDSKSTFGVESYMVQADGQVDNDARIAANNPWLRPREIVGCLVCVDFSAWLPELLALNKQHFDRMVVVTTPADTRTQEIATAAGVGLVVSDACYAHGDAFNKGALLNLGLEYLKPKDWVLFHDADVLLAPDWGRWLRSRVLNAGVLYHAKRLHAMDDAQWDAALRDWGTTGQLKIRDPSADLLPFGFHQLWNVRAAAIAGREPDRLVSEMFPTAATVDYHWYRLWPEDKRVRLPDVLSIVHRWHGQFAARWHNRGVPKKGWQWIGQVSPVGPLWFLGGKEPRWPAEVKLIDLDTEQAEIGLFTSRRHLQRQIGHRVVDVYSRTH